MFHETHIIGREKELSILHDIYNKAKSGQGQIVLLAGEAGMGKTLLAEKSLFSSGFKVYTGRIMEKSTPAYGPVSSILSDILKEHPGILKDLKSVRSQLKLLLPEFEGFSGFSLGEKEAARERSASSRARSR